MDEAIVRMQAQVYAIVAEMEGIKAALYGMEWENKGRILKGESIAYPEQCFSDVRHDLEKLAKKLREI